MGRLRNIPGADDVLSKSAYVVQNPAEHAGHWQELFAQDEPKPLFAEFGMGKGKFITQMAALHPESNYIGVERYSSVLLRAVQKLQGSDTAAETGSQPESETAAVPSAGDRFTETAVRPNLRLLCADAADADQIFADGELSGVYLNFSDPWPKDRHAKRRLVAPGFLALFAKVTKTGGVLEFKTDNTDLFAFGLESLLASPDWELLYETRDLHADEALYAGNVMTEYEEKFSTRGQAICKFAAKRL